MDTPTSSPASRPDTQTTAIGAEALTSDGDATLQIEGGAQQSGYSILIQGDIQASSILSTNDPEEAVTLLENDTQLVSGSVSGDVAGFVLTGTIVAVEFDDPAPTIKIDGAYVDPDQWPSVKEYTGYGPGQDAVEDPFPNSGELGASPGDPLNPEEYIIELEATGTEQAEAYCFDIEGHVIDHSVSTTVADERVYGCLQPGRSARIAVSGMITRIDTADGIGFSVRARDSSQHSS